MKFSKKPIALAAFSLLAGAPLAAHAVSVSFSRPSSGATLRDVNWSNSSACEVTGSSIRRVTFTLINSSGRSTTLNTDTGSPWRCTLDSSDFANGKYTLRATAYDSSGRTATASRSVTISNTTTGGSTGGGTTGTLPTMALAAPAAGVPLKGNVQGPPNCTVTGSNIAKIEFYLNGVLTNTDGNATNGWGCWIDTTKYPDGAYSLKAIAFNAAGQTTTATWPITIQNGTTGTTNVAPTVGITAPGSSATLAGTAVPYTMTASDSDGSVAKVELSVIAGGTQKVVATKTAAPYSGTFSTSGLPNGAATLMAVATDNLGKQTSVQRSVSINNTVVSDPGGGTGGGTSPVADSHIIGKARADVAFSQQSGYSAQVIGQHTSVTSIPESGINGTTLSNGETLRVGKAGDPRNSAAKVFQFQLGPNDPDTSGSKRAEFSFTPNIEMNKVYWIAVSTYVHDWGNLGSGDMSLFGTQLHSGANNLGLSPSFGLYTSSGGRNFHVEARWAAGSCSSGCSTTKANYADQPIPFGRWVDFVFKFKQNTSGSGFLQVWMDGQQIVNHTGNLGFSTGATDYAKFGYYNWSSFNSSRKVMLRSPTIVTDPTGSTYSQEQVRALLGGTSAEALAGSTSTTGSTTTTAGSGVCSTALCVAAQ